ncbi:MAG: hypothetical protein KAJ60_06030 [Desulfobulbaceae bacterium]|nr:hypothetical protein [Desulfobulbaceae bacterium]MCK5404526.1 hypothetical protein [Desulfobulbaceae bacterium]
MKKIFLIPFMLLAFCVLQCIGSVPGEAAIEGALWDLHNKKYYLKCNLHVDPNRHKLSSVNYQLRGYLLTWGTPVKIVEIHRNKVLLQDLDTEKEYYYEFHWRTRKATSLKTHLMRILTTDLEALKKQVSLLQQVDHDGIYKGLVLKGMTRKGVLVAIGYPPEFVNKSLMKEKQWHYWFNRNSKFHVSFDQQGKVYEINGTY